VLADDLAQPVPNLGSTAVAVSICVPGRKLFNRTRKRSDLLDRADADAVGLPQGSVDSSSFGDAHFGAADEGGDIGRVGVAVSDETPALF